MQIINVGVILENFFSLTLTFSPHCLINIFQNPPTYFLLHYRLVAVSNLFYYAVVKVIIQNMDLVPSFQALAHFIAFWLKIQTLKHSLPLHRAPLCRVPATMIVPQFHEGVMLPPTTFAYVLPLTYNPLRSAPLLSLFMSYQLFKSQHR